MKKKLLLVLLSIISALAIAFGITGCADGSENSTENKWGNVFTIEAAYAEATDLGYSGSLEEFIKSISGKDGTNGANGADGIGISTIEIVSESLVLTLTDGTAINLGNVKGEKGDDGVSPTLRINTSDNTWEVSYDGGNNWLSL
ncbi:MAG: hypothetical protein ACI4L9_02665, partial [Candidatus Coproplasma sp.]